MSQVQPPRPLGIRILSGVLHLLGRLSRYLWRSFRRLSGNAQAVIFIGIIILGALAAGRIADSLSSPGPDVTATAAIVARAATPSTSVTKPPTPIPGPTHTTVPSPTVGPTLTPTLTPTAAPTNTPTVTYTPSNTPLPTVTRTPTVAPTPTLTDAEYEATARTDVTYEQLMRDPDGMSGTWMRLRGEVIQIVSQNDQGIEMRVSITRGEYFWQDDVYVWSAEPLDQRLLEEDVITFYGVSVGVLQYKTALGVTREVPNILITRIAAVE